jgi:DUF4097 and DUF4098 domain-containing protein YvlB
VYSHSSSAFRHARFTATVVDGVLRVKGSCDGGFVIADSCSVDFTIYVPPEATVRTTSHTGDVAIFGAHGSVLVSTDTGDVQTRQTSGSVRLKTNTGDVDADLLASNDVTAETDTGDVNLHFSAAPNRAQAVTDTGDIWIGVPKDGVAYQVVADSKIGDEAITVPTQSSSTRVITAETSTGDVQVSPDS